MNTSHVKSRCAILIASEYVEYRPLTVSRLLFWIVTLVRVATPPMGELIASQEELYPNLDIGVATRAS